MSFQTKIGLAAKYADIYEKDIASRIGLSKSAFIHRKRLGRYSADELERMAEIMGARYEHYFVFPDGTRI